MNLEISSAEVCFLIDKACEFQAREDVNFSEIPDGFDNDQTLKMLANYSDDPVATEFITTVNDLEPDQQIYLVALMWLGRGDFLLDEWDDAVLQATESYNNRCAEYLLATPLLADYWREGLNLHEYSCDDEE